ARWMKDGDHAKEWASKWESEIRVSFEAYETVVEFVPVSQDLGNDESLREVERVSSLKEGCIKRARWIKPIERRSSKQRVAHAIFSFDGPESANQAISNGVIIQGKSLEARRSLPEPQRCLKCQKLGHFARECKREGDVCGRCAGRHSTGSCLSSEPFCANCNTPGHGAADRSCPSFAGRTKALYGRRLDIRYRFFVTDAPETWVKSRD
ncbi:hypothetical protein FB446DRAFT_603000, partial [Lentinula raphanica]